jgi:hypothetical protein
MGQSKYLNKDKGINMESWIQTYTGKHFDIFNPRIEDICIEDIAHGLSLQCRFNGHCNKFYSIAEHCIRMACWDLPGDPKQRLFHDAAEAYIGDIPSPIKQNLSEFEKIEENLLEIIFKKFKIQLYNKDIIKKADLIMLATEVRDLMNNPNDWKSLPTPYHEKINPWDWKLAQVIFIKTAEGYGII